MTYEFLQQYWWFLVSLLGALFVFLTFVQGANSMIFTLAKTEDERQKLISCTGKKWELTFTTLVTFGGAFFASFPLFYSTSFGGAYWVWMLILFTFVLQAVSYEYHFPKFLVLNGCLGPLLVGTAVGTFFNGAEFTVCKDNMLDGQVISVWTGALGGLEAIFDIWNVVLGLAVMFLSRTLGLLYIINNVEDERLGTAARKRLRMNALVFVACFVAFVVHLLVKDGWQVDPAGAVSLAANKYLHNFLDMPVVLAVFLLGVVLVLTGIGMTLFSKSVRGIWSAGFGAVFAVLGLFLVAGWNDTCYYPSLTDMQSSLCLQNSSSSEFTLKVMSIVSLLIPFVLAYIVWAWRAIDRKRLRKED